MFNGDVEGDMTSLINHIWIWLFTWTLGAYLPVCQAKNDHETMEIMMMNID